jgi:hypothetical protein
VVWQGSAGNRCPYADLTGNSDVTRLRKGCGSYCSVARIEMPSAVTPTDRALYVLLTDAHLTSGRLDRHRSAFVPWLMPRPCIQVRMQWLEVIARDAIVKSAKGKEKRIRRGTCNRGFICAHLDESPQALQPSKKERPGHFSLGPVISICQHRAGQRSCSLAAYSSRRASSASSARSVRNAKNSLD